MNKSLKNWCIFNVYCNQIRTKAEKIAINKFGKKRPTFFQNQLNSMIIFRSIPYKMRTLAESSPVETKESEDEDIFRSFGTDSGHPGFGFCHSKWPQARKEGQARPSQENDAKGVLHRKRSSSSKPNLNQTILFNFYRSTREMIAETFQLKPWWVILWWKDAWT